MNKSIDREAERRNAFESRAGSRRRGSPGRPFRERGIALVVVLSFIVIVSLILVAFVTAMRLEQTASASYSSSLRADETALGALTLVVADLQKEMDAGGAADLTFPGKPLYTNVTSANIRPQRIGVSSSMTNLVRVSGDSSFTNSPGAVSGLRGSTNLSSTPSMNGRYVSAQRWAEVYLGDFTNQPVPGWIFLSRMGATNGAGALFTGANAVNNPAPDNGNYIGARFAYAVYDVGGLLDISMAGYPTQSISVAAAQAIKGTLAGADLSALAIDPEALTKWRNAKSASSGTNYLNYITNTAIRNGFKEVATGDTTFLSHQDLIKAAKISVAGLYTNALPVFPPFRGREMPQAISRGRLQAVRSTMGHRLARRPRPMFSSRSFAETRPRRSKVIRSMAPHSPTRWKLGNRLCTSASHLIVFVGWGRTDRRAAEHEAEIESRLAASTKHEEIPGETAKRGNYGFRGRAQECVGIRRAARQRQRFSLQVLHNSCLV